MYTQDTFGINRSLPFKIQDTLRSYGSSAKQAFKDYVKVNSPGFNASESLGITPSTPRPTSSISSVLKLPGGSSSALRLPSFSLGSSAGYSGGSSPSEGSGDSPALDYYNAVLAQHYGMDASTAYQEALANTSYQRSVRDMLDAGLNPSVLFAAGRVSGSDGVGYATQIGSGSGGSTGGGSAKNKYIFSKGLYQALQVVGGGLAVAATKHPSTYFAGQSAAKGIMQAINGFFG